VHEPILGLNEITLVLQQIKKMFFTNEFKPQYSPTLFPKNEYMVQYNFYLSPSRIAMACIKVEKDPRDSKDLEELKHLTFKEFVGTREVRDTLSGDTNISYANP
jgi:hypothetical protein